MVSAKKNHAVLDNILERLDEDYPNLDLEAKLAWAGMAKNSLQMVYGYSPNQLVFGQNPKLPNVVQDGPGSWESITSSETIAKHLNLLHAARKGFLQSESCQKLKTALKAKIRCMEYIYQQGDIVYYKRAKDGRWMGPGKVVFQDGKVIFVRNGANLIRVSVNRIVKAGTELSKKVLAREAELTSKPDSDIEELLPTPDSKADQPGSKKKVKNSIFGKISAASSEFENSQENSAPEAYQSEDEFSMPPASDNNEVTSNETAPNPVSNGHDSKASGSVILKKNERIRFMEGNRPIKATIIGRAAKATGSLRNWYNVLRDGEEVAGH